MFKPSDFAIINTDGNSDFDVESRLTLRDATDRKLDLRLNYVYAIIWISLRHIANSSQAIS